MPARMSSQKWLPVAITANQTQTGQRSQSSLQPLRPDDEGEAHADDQRVGRVQARHGRVRVRVGADDPAVVVDAEAGERVHEAELREHAAAAPSAASTKPTSPITFASRIVFRNRTK